MTKKHFLNILKLHRYPKGKFVLLHEQHNQQENIIIHKKNKNNLISIIDRGCLIEITYGWDVQHKCQTLLLVGRAYWLAVISVVAVEKPLLWLFFSSFYMNMIVFCLFFFLSSWLPAVKVCLPTSALILQDIYYVKSVKSSALLWNIHSDCIENHDKKLTTWWSKQTCCAHWARAVKGNIREWNSSNSNGIKLAFQIMLQLVWIWNNWYSHFNGFPFLPGT